MHNLCIFLEGQTKSMVFFDIGYYTKVGLKRRVEYFQVKSYA